MALEYLDAYKGVLPDFAAMVYHTTKDTHTHTHTHTHTQKIPFASIHRSANKFANLLRPILLKKGLIANN
jgi:hypothetical protein